MVGKRWMWKLQHMTGQREINELHVPVGVPVKLTLTSEDVIHSFFVPAFRVKKDAVPGALHDHLVPGDASPGATTCSAPSTAAREHSNMIGIDRGAWSRPPSRPGWPAALGRRRSPPRGRSSSRTSPA